MNAVQSDLGCLILFFVLYCFFLSVVRHYSLFIFVFLLFDFFFSFLSLICLTLPNNPVIIAAIAATVFAEL